MRDSDIDALSADGAQESPPTYLCAACGHRYDQHNSVVVPYGCVAVDWSSSDCVNGYQGEHPDSGWGLLTAKASVPADESEYMRGYDDALAEARVPAAPLTALTDREAPATRLRAVILSQTQIAQRVREGMLRLLAEVEAEASVPAHDHDPDRCDECIAMVEEALRD